MALFLAFVSLLLGNFLVADWAVVSIHETWQKIVFWPLLHLLFPVGAYYYIVLQDPLEDYGSEPLGCLWAVFGGVPLYIAGVALVQDSLGSGPRSLLMLPIIIGAPILAIATIVLALAAPFYLFSFFRTLCATTVPRHPAHEIIHSGLSIEPDRARLLEQELRASSEGALGFSKMQLDIRNSRVRSLLVLLEKRVSNLKANNQKLAQEQHEAIENRFRAERERAEELARAMKLDAKVTEQIVELIRAEARGKRLKGD